jgi:hypothetical protein
MLLFAGIVWIFTRYLAAYWMDWIYVSIGVLIGHLFWGMPYIPDEGDNKTKQKTYGYKDEICK